MRVTYTPSLMDQIKNRKKVTDSEFYIVRADGRLVERVDPETQRCTGEPQPFKFSEVSHG